MAKGSRVWPVNIMKHINKNTEKGMYLVILERFSSNIWYVTIFCEYPVSLKLLLNILYPNNFFLKYPVSR